MLPDCTAPDCVGGYTLDLIDISLTLLPHPVIIHIAAQRFPTETSEQIFGLVEAGKAQV